MLPRYVLLGLASSGCHSKCFSLIQKIIETFGLKYSDQAPWADKEIVGESLLTPTRIYVRTSLEAMKDELIIGAAHITGDDLLDNVPRMLPKTLAAEIAARIWTITAVLSWLKKAENIEHEEFARVFNTGIGIVLVVSEEKEDPVREGLREAGETVYTVERLVERREAEVGCVVNNLEVWN